MTFEQAEEGFARLVELYFDWNEVRVTTAKELSEAMVGYHQPLVAATSEKCPVDFRNALHLRYRLQKKKSGESVDKIKNYRGMTSFVVLCVSIGLGGHSLPLGAAEMALMLAGVITEKEKQKSSVPGLNVQFLSKGVEFFPLCTSWSHFWSRQIQPKSERHQRNRLKGEEPIQSTKEEKAAIKAAEEVRRPPKRKR